MWCGVVCSGVLLCAVVCCGVLCRAVPCCAVLCCALLCCALLCCAGRKSYGKFNPVGVRFWQVMLLYRHVCLSSQHQNNIVFHCFFFVLCCGGLGRLRKIKSAASWWFGAPKGEKKVRKNGSEKRSEKPKWIQKSMKNCSWRALGGLWGALGGQDGLFGLFIT